MQFCPKCDALLILDPKKSKPGKPVLKCRDCDYSSSDKSKAKDYVLSEEVAHSEKDTIEIVTETENDNISSEIREELTEQYREAIEGFDY